MKHLFNLALSLFIVLPIWSQNIKQNKTIEITYVKAYKNFKDSTNTPPKAMKGLEYKLICNTNEARFEYISSMNNDGQKTNQRFVGRGGGEGVYYKNLKERIKLHKTKSVDENLYLIKEELNKYNWKLLKETKKILGYDCFKAIGELKEYSYIRKKDLVIPIVVWYVPTIAAPFGPAGYDGLPGLILESSSSSFYLIANNIEFHNEKIKIRRPTKGKEVTADEFNRLLSEAFEKRFKQ